jgi:hypothetical protein
MRPRHIANSLLMCNKDVDEFSFQYTWWIGMFILWLLPHSLVSRFERLTARKTQRCFYHFRSTVRTSWRRHRCNGKAELCVNEVQNALTKHVWLWKQPFQDVDDEFIHADSISPQNPLQPSLMAVPLHILSLRRIAGNISRKVYGNVKNANLTLPEREAIIASLHQELLDWRRSMPFPLPDVNESVPHLNTTWYDFNYYTHLAMIYRPSPLFPVSDLKRIKNVGDGSVHVTPPSIQHASATTICLQLVEFSRSLYGDFVTNLCNNGSTWRP